MTVVRLLARAIEEIPGLSRLALLSAAIAVLVTIVGPRRYESRVSFVPASSEENLAGLAGLAGQFGFQIPGGGASFGPQFYLELIESRTVLDSVLRMSLPASVREESKVSTVLELVEAEGDTRAARFEDGMERLRNGHLSARLTRETGVVTVSVVTQSPSASLLIAEEIVRQVQRFNVESQQALASDERNFLQERVRSLEVERDSAERALQAFLERNREFAASPALRFEHDRLQRLVSMRQEVLTGVIEAFEAARIKEVRDTRAISVVERPVFAARPLSRGAAARAVLGALLGTLLGLVYLYLVEAGSIFNDADMRRLREAIGARSEQIRTLLGIRTRASGD